MPPPMTAMSYSCMAVIFTWPYTAASKVRRLFMSGFFCTRAGIQAHRPIRMPRSIRGFFFALIMALGTAHPVLAQGTRVQTPYANPKAIVDVYLDHPAKMGAALYWVRSLVNPLTEAPYSLFPEDMSIIVLLHGTELVTVARKNEAKYEGAGAAHALLRIPGREVQGLRPGAAGTTATGTPTCSPSSRSPRRR
jgi:hypothetical protein